MEVTAIVLAAIVGVGVAALLFKPLFGDWHGFVDCLKFWFTPDMWSILRGQFVEDWWAEMKLGLWFLAAGLAGVGTYTGLMQLFG
ncbi:MAG: hypothetical protein ACYTAF_01325 [Planctomycetota bacterium]|jgi:hypothetical protein